MRIDTFEKLHLVTYGDSKYSNSKLFLKKEANNLGIQNVNLNGPDTLPGEFVERHSVFFSRNQRGGGYWLWKPCIVKKALDGLKDNDFLLYADAGCSVNHLNGKKRLGEWLEMCDDNGSLSFQMSHLPEKNWSKMNLAKFMKCDSASFMETGQLVGGIFMLKKTKKNVEIVDEWLNICSLEWTIDDSPSTVENDPTFKEHRHDQSVFSLLRKRENYFIIEDETYPAKTHDWSDPCVREVPILATRRKF